MKMRTDSNDNDGYYEAVEINFLEKHEEHLYKMYLEINDRLPQELEDLQR